MNDAVFHIVRRPAQHEGILLELAELADAAEGGVIEPDRIVSRREIGDRVVVSAPRLDVEKKSVPARAAREYVPRAASRQPIGSGIAGQSVLPGPSVQPVVAAKTHQPVGTAAAFQAVGAAVAL